MRFGGWAIVGDRKQVPVGAVNDITDPIEMEKAADALLIEQVAKRWIVGTDPDPHAVIAQVKDYVDWGFNHLVFHAPGHDQERFMTLFERDLAPRLRVLCRPQAAGTT